VARIEFDVQGPWPSGKMLGSCGDHEICFEDKPKALPVVPKLEKDQRVVLTVLDGKPAWKVREQTVRNAMVASGGVSLTTLVAAYLAARKIEKWWAARQESE
jgi:hypothetical protein